MSIYHNVGRRFGNELALLRASIRLNLYLQPMVDKFPSGLYSLFKFFLYDEIIPAVIAFYYGNDYNYEKETTYDTWRKDLQTES